jgi:hypothetical protein
MSDQIGSLMGQGSSIVPVSGAMSAMSGLSGIGSGMLAGFSQPKTLGALQAGTSVLSGLGAMQAYDSRASSDQIQAGEYRSEAGDEFVQGQSQISGLKSQYLNDIGSLTAKAGAGGVDVGQGLSQNARQVIGQNAATAENVTSLASDIRARRDNINAIQAEAAAKEADSAGVLGLVGGILGGGLKMLSGGVL